MFFRIEQRLFLGGFWWKLSLSIRLTMMAESCCACMRLTLRVAGLCRVRGLWGATQIRKGHVFFFKSFLPFFCFLYLIKDWGLFSCLPSSSQKLLWIYVKIYMNIYGTLASFASMHWSWNHGLSASWEWFMCFLIHAINKPCVFFWHVIGLFSWSVWMKIPNFYRNAFFKSLYGCYVYLGVAIFLISSRKTNNAKSSHIDNSFFFFFCKSCISNPVFLAELIRRGGYDARGGRLDFCVIYCLSLV